MADETRVIRIVVDSSKAVDGSSAATRAYERMEKAQRDVVTSVDRMEKALGRMGGFLKAQLALMIASVAARLIEMGKNAFDAASGLDELAEQLGVTNDFLQASQFLAAQSGVKLEQLESAYGKFSQKMGEAADGSKEMIEKLEQLGIKNLDLAGKLRPTEDLLQDVAAAISAIDDPAKRAAAAVDFFGKSGMKLLPMMADLAAGADLMTSKMIQAGAYIGPQTAKKLDELADAGERSSLRWRAMLANMIAAMADWYERNKAIINMMTMGLSGLVEQLVRDPQKFTGAIGEAYDAAARKAGDWIDATKMAFDIVLIASARFVAGFSEAIRSIPDLLGKAFVDGINKAIEGLEIGLGKITTQIEKFAPWLGIKGGTFDFGRVAGGGASLADRNAGIRAAEDKAEAEMRARGYGRDYRVDRAQQRQIDQADWFANQEANYGVPATPPSPGAGRSAVKGAGEDVADRMSKALGESARDLDQARAFAEAAGQGADAVARLEIHFKALKTAQDVFGKAANDNTKGVAELTAKLEEQALATVKLKNLGDFRAGTAALRDQNELLEAEVRLANELPDIRARELAVLKVMQEVRAKGLSDNKDEIADRIAVMEANERLKTQADEIKRANEMWTEPLKSALQSIQSSAADMWEKILENGKFSMEEFGQLFIRTARRAAAELLALSTIRPVIGMGVEALGSIGLVSPGTASALGYGSSPGSGGMPGLGGGGGLSTLFGGSSSFFSQPLASLFSSSTPAGGFADVGALLASGQTGASAAASGIGGLGGIGIGSALGAIGGIGMGAYQALTSKSTAGTIGGIGSMIGAGVSLIPGFGQIAGPLIMMASALLPGLIGEPDTRTHSSTNANLRYGSGGWYTTGGAYGAGANSGQSEAALRGTTTGIDALFGLMGGIKDPSKVWGLNASSWTAQGKDWSYTSNATHLVDPSGNKTAWRMNTDNMMDTGAAQVAVLSMLSGAVGELGANTKTALEAMRSYAPTMQEVGKNLVFVTETYDRLGKGALTVKSEFDSLTAKFSEMTTTAQKLGLSLAPIEAEQKRATERLGQDFIDGLVDPIAVQLRAWEDEKASILANVEYISQHTDVIVDQARITEALLRKEAALKEQLYGGAISQLEEAIKRLTPGGDLANLDPSGMLAGLKATYQATYAQAAAGDAAAIGRFGSESAAYADYAKSYYAGSPEYNAIKLQIIEALQTIQASVVGPVTPPGDAAASGASNPNGAQLQQLMGTINNLVSELQAERAESAKLRALLSRYITTQSAA